jgi:hypothetical protein
MVDYNVVVVVTDNEYSDIATTVYSVEIVAKRYGKHSVASAWQLVEKREVKIRLFFVDYWTQKSISIYSVDFEKVSKRLSELNFVDIWVEKL